MQSYITKSTEIVANLKDLVVKTPTNSVLFGLISVISLSITVAAVYKYFFKSASKIEKFYTKLFALTIANCAFFLSGLTAYFVSSIYLNPDVQTNPSIFNGFNIIVFSLSAFILIANLCFIFTSSNRSIELMRNRLVAAAVGLVVLILPYGIFFSNVYVRLAIPILVLISLSVFTLSLKKFTKKQETKTESN